MDRIVRYVRVRSGAVRYLAVGGLVAVLMLLFAEVAEELLDNELVVFDAYAREVLLGLTGAVPQEGVVFLTRLGDTWTLIAICLLAVVVLIWHYTHIREAVLLIVCLAGGGLLNGLLKRLFARDRPELERLIEVGGYSFPSGHAMVSLCFYGMLAYLLRRALRLQRLGSALVTAGALLLAGGIGLSRIYLGVHYASDVLAGFAAGGVWLIFCIIGLKTISTVKGARP